MEKEFSSQHERFYGARKETLSRLKDLYKSPKGKYVDTEELKIKRKQMFLQEFRKVESIFDIKKGGNILDIGCGTGEFLLLFNEMWNKYGIELSDPLKKIAEQNGIITEFELKDDFFDLIVFRGTIQHIPDPIHRIGECYYWLKENGGLMFLATPNTNSLVYRLFCDLPMIESRYNFLLPSDKMLRQILENFGFEVIAFEYPYRGTPYASPLKDVVSFLLRLLHLKKKVDFPFFGNMMECYARKKPEVINLAGTDKRSMV